MLDLTLQFSFMRPFNITIATPWPSLSWISSHFHQIYHLPLLFLPLLLLSLNISGAAEYLFRQKYRNQLSFSKLKKNQKNKLQGNYTKHKNTDAVFHISIENHAGNIYLVFTSVEWFLPLLGKLLIIGTIRCGC